MGSAWACPKSGNCDKKGATVVKSDAKAGAKKGGCGKSAATVSGSKSPCGKNCGKNCTKNCKHKSAVLAADGAKTKPCPLTGKPIEEKDCPIAKKVEAILASLPSMKYRVGDETTCCSHAAEGMAKVAGKSIQYVVGENTFDKEGDAMVKLASLLETEVELLKTVQFATGGKCYQCPMTAKDMAKKSNDKVVYRVGGVDFQDKETAEKVVKLVSEKLADVKMAYKVGEKSFCCDKMAGAEVKQSGKKMLYVVDGEETDCPTAAKFNMARAQIRKIVETAASMAL
ncbi:MAG: hypothetical protein IIB57_09430 [Planctomycetes bacterium]|nr:hypothetical protein [Planctomycetota bacterium]